MRIWLLVVLFGLSSSLLYCQAKYDYNWILGHPPFDPKDYFGGVHLDFNSNLVTTTHFPVPYWMFQPAVLSSPDGELLVYSDGCRILDGKHAIITNGDSISYGEFWEDYCDYGYRGTQNHILLPWPGDSLKAIMIHNYVLDDYSSYHFLYTTIHFTEHYDSAWVVEKNVFILDPGTSSLVTAVRHGNGRDWWVIIPENATNRFFKILIEPDGVAVIDTQSIGAQWEEREWGGQALFSPDGRRYIRFNPFKGLDVFKFNRCTGQLSNAIESGPLTDPVLQAGGAAVSPSSRYLYVANMNQMYQYDLEAVDLLASRELIGTYDGFKDPFPTTFYQMMLAPDGRIYGFAPSGIRSLHVINHPEGKGSACGFVQHQLKLPAALTIGFTNLPYYRLGPADKSSCDTLGLDNKPIADFRYEIDTTYPMVVHFRNLSYFEPRFFHWDFGNSIESGLKDPGSIVYDAPGLYEVCLTVSNEYGQHTFCRELEIRDTTTSIGDIFSPDIFRLDPNPFSEILTITCPVGFGGAIIEMYTIDGRFLESFVLEAGSNTIKPERIMEGIYLYRFKYEGNVLQHGKIIKVY